MYLESPYRAFYIHSKASLSVFSGYSLAIIFPIVYKASICDIFLFFIKRTWWFPCWHISKKKRVFYRSFLGLQYYSISVSVLQPYALKRRETGMKLSCAPKLKSCLYLKFKTRSFTKFTARPFNLSSFDFSFKRMKMD